MGFAEQMISSIRNNNRRKRLHNPFTKKKKEYSKGTPIHSKEFTQLEKDLLMKELKENRELENGQRIYKLIISIGLTAIFIIGFVSILKFIFF